MVVLGRDRMKKTLLCMCVVLIAVMVFGLAGCTSEVVTGYSVTAFLQEQSNKNSNTITCASDWKTEILIIVSRKVNFVSITFS